MKCSRQSRQVWPISIYHKFRQRLSRRSVTKVKRGLCGRWFDNLILMSLVFVTEEGKRHYIEYFAII